MDSALLVLFAAVLIVGVLLIVIISVTRRMPSAINKEEFQQRWLAIEQSVSSEQGTMQLAILNADKLVDSALKQKGLSGKTMGERMKSAKDKFSDRNGIWYAHKLRNQIAHESVTVTPSQTKNALQAFKRALRDLGAI